jgi:hypothetical protein
MEAELAGGRIITRRSRSGHTYSVWEPNVPRIRNEFLDCVIYLYPSEIDADQGERAGGSGFLVGVPAKWHGPDSWFLYAVTNKHVIRNSSVIRMNSSNGEKVIMSIPRNSWVWHPSGDDLAVCLIHFDPNEIAFNFVRNDMFITKEIVDGYNIGPGDDVFMVGRFINHEGRQKNIPSVRFGNIAQMPWETIQQDDGFEQESFLVECRSISGYSGSPIFVHIPPASIRNAPNWKPASPLIAHGPWLLGIDWGHIHNWTPVCRDNGMPVNPDPKLMQVKLDTGMAAAVPAWKLAEILNQGPLADFRAHIESEAANMVTSSVATMDSEPTERTGRDHTGKRKYVQRQIANDDIIRIHRCILCGLGLPHLTKHL